MNREAASAIENAIAIEVKKDGLRQKQSGEWCLSFTVAATDMDRRLTEAAMGQRFQAVLVAINEDETPVDHKAKERDKWRDLGPAKQAGIRCKDPVFWAYLSEIQKYGLNGVHSEQVAAEAVRYLCNIDSRSDLNKPGQQQARIKWHDLDFAFQAWKAVEHA
jgi:hypothetical protein